MVHAHSRPRRASSVSSIAVDAQRGHESCVGNVTMPHARAPAADQLRLVGGPGEDAFRHRHLRHQVSVRRSAAHATGVPSAACSCTTPSCTCATPSGACGSTATVSGCRSSTTSSRRTTGRRSSGSSRRRLRAVILGDPDDPDVGQVELLTLAPPVPAGPPPTAPTVGSVMLSFHVHLDSVLPMLLEAGAAEFGRVTLRDGTRVVTVRDPDGFMVELLDTVAHA